MNTHQGALAGARDVLPGAAIPLYARVKALILRNIGDGTWPRDRRLPSEHDLVALTGASRMTVHRALRELTHAGVLHRVQGVGTFVAAPMARSGLIEIEDIAQEIRRRGAVHGSRVLLLDRVEAPGEVMSAFGEPGCRRPFHSVLVHSEDGTPVQHEERYVDPELAPDYGRQDFSARTPFDYLIEAVPLTEFEHVISAVAASPAIAAALDLPQGAPCLRLDRRTWSGARIATVNRLTYAGERCRLATRRVVSTS
ncbi:histidine utilization repressor [Lichenibacterium minor]|uniref:histidine utilization repressor n=1 Tax=Lichenibacterium minor TaxID=2316528 RepID=UPI001FE19BDA|nr:histidine utilization repressor [Lichenibacterium minor]